MVKLVSVTSGNVDDKTLSAEDLIAYTARVSNPANQMNSETAPKLLKYLIKNKHWSPFEMAHMTVEITTSRAIAQQILRHKSFAFQEFSQRYSTGTDWSTDKGKPKQILYKARRQDDKNRQNSIDDMPESTKIWFEEAQKVVNRYANQMYKEALEKGIAKEQARFLLPLNTETKLYMSGSVRSWIHYLDLRCANGTQLEHKEIADAIKAVFIKQFPSVAEGLDWEK